MRNEFCIKENNLRNGLRKKKHFKNIGETLEALTQKTVSFSKKLEASQFSTENCEMNFAKNTGKTVGKQTVAKMQSKSIYPKKPSPMEMPEKNKHSQKLWGNTRDINHKKFFQQKTRSLPVVDRKPRNEFCQKRLTRYSNQKTFASKQELVLLYTSLPLSCPGMAGAGRSPYNREHNLHH